MPWGLNDRQRRFCELVVEGRSAAQAYRDAGYQAKGKSAENAASRLLGNDGVAAYVEELRAEARNRWEGVFDELIQFFLDAIRTPIADIDDGHPLCQEIRHYRDKDGNNTGTMVKMIGKIEAGRELAKLLALYEPQKYEIEVKSFEAKLIEIIKSPDDINAFPVPGS